LLLTPPPLPNNDSTITNNNDLPVLKVADFGFARFLPNASLADTLCGSPLYMGPEILSYKKYDAKADLWSVGAVLYEMVTGRPPFRAQNHIELLKKIQENNDQIHFPDERHEDIVIGSDIKDLIRKLLKKNPQERLSFEDFFQHPAVLVQQQQQLPQPIRRSSLNQFKTTRHTPPSPRQGTSYEPPPFAQTTPKSLTDQPQLMTTRRWSTTIPATQDTK
jgi:serine/threonine-protein kinase ULK/ATG1